MLFGKRECSGEGKRGRRMGVRRNLLFFVCLFRLAGGREGRKGICTNCEIVSRNIKTRLAVLVVVSMHVRIREANM